MGLYQTLTLAALHCGIDWFIAILDMPVFRILRWKLRMIFAGYEGIGPLPYLGSAASLPAWCDVTRPSGGWPSRTRTCTPILRQGGGPEAGASASRHSPAPTPTSSDRGEAAAARRPQLVTSRSRCRPSDATTSGSRSAPTGREYRKPCTASHPSRLRRAA